MVRSQTASCSCPVPDNKVQDPFPGDPQLCWGQQPQKEAGWFLWNPRAPKTIKIMLEGDFFPVLVHMNYSVVFGCCVTLCVHVCMCHCPTWVNWDHVGEGGENNPCQLKRRLVTDLFHWEGKKQNHSLPKRKYVCKGLD